MAAESILGRWMPGLLLRGKLAVRDLQPSPGLSYVNLSAIFVHQMNAGKRCMKSVCTPGKLFLTVRVKFK
jgi:hypothetical protein